MSEEKPIEPFENQSLYDPSRKTVGAIYRDAKLANSEDKIEVGDMTRELIVGYVDDLNGCIHDVSSRGNWRGREFYVQLVYQKDLAMPNMIKFRMAVSLYRPWPEDDTDVYRVNAEHNDIRFCWALPHHSEMDNMLINSWLYHNQMIHDIRMWKALQMEHFGFVKVGIGEEWAMNPMFTFDKDRKMEKPRRLISAQPNAILA
jgi:hypothetical protein